MSAHDEACRGSQQLCDELYATLKSLIPALSCAPAQRWCGYYAPSRRRLAFVSHFKTSDRVEVWCRGHLHALQKAGPPQVRPRTRTESGGWEDDFPGRFELTSASQIPSAARLLHAVSFPSS